ncbi:hypothetical protein D3C75_579340 [compost metagenome]
MGVTGVGADQVHGARLLYEVFADVVDLFRLAFDLDAKRTLQHRCIDEGRFRMGVGRRRGTRPILDDHAPHALARDVGNGTVEHHRHLAGGRLGG